MLVINTDDKRRKQMNEKINKTDEYLLKKASELYKVPYEVIEGAYSLGVREGIYLSIKKMGENI